MYQDVLELVQANPRGLSIQDISDGVGLSRNSVTRYIDVLVALGQLEMRRVGVAKLYYVSSRVALNTLLDYSNDAILVADKHLNVTQVNDTLCEMMNTSHDDIVDKPVTEVLSPFRVEAFISEILDEARNGGDAKKVVTVEIKNVHYTYEVAGYPTAFIDGRTGITLIIHDITERRKLINEVRVEKERWEELITSIPDPVFINNASHWLYTNQQAADLCGYESPAELVKHSIASCYIEEEREMLLERAKQRLEGVDDIHRFDA